MGGDKKNRKKFKVGVQLVRVPNVCAKHTTRARSAKSLTAGVQGPLKGPGSSGYFRRSMVVSDAFLTPVFSGKSELLW